MEVFGTITAAIDLVQKIKATFDQAKANRREGLMLSSEIVDSLLRIQDLLRQHSLANSPELQNDLTEFENGLRTTLSRRERLVAKKSDDFWDRSVGWLKEVYRSGDIKDELVELRQRIQDCHQNLQLKCMVRIDDGVSNANVHLAAIRDEQGAEFPAINQKVDRLENILLRIEAKVQVRITEAENDIVEAQALVGLSSMSPIEASQSLADAKETLLSGNSSSDEETKYLRVKVKALTEVVPKLLVGGSLTFENAPTTGSRAWEAFTPGTGRTDEKREDSVQELIRILKLLRSGDLDSMDTVEDLEDLGMVLGSLGLFEEMEGILTCAVDIRRELSKKGGLASITRFAMAKQNLSVVFNNTGKLTEALIVAEESVELCRQCLRDSESHIPKQQSSLTKPSISSREEGVSDKISKDVPVPAKDDTKLFLPFMACSLNSLAWSEHLLNRHETALLHVEEALQILTWCEDAGNRQPAAFAIYLDTKSICLSNLSRHDEAVTVGQSCLDIMRRLYNRQPNSHRDRLAEYMLSHSRVLYRKGDLVEAKAVNEESVDHFRILSRATPLRFNPGLKEALEHLAQVHTALGEVDMAGKVSEEASTIQLESRFGMISF